METQKTEAPGSRLIPVLREGICVVQMILFKELRVLLSRKYPALEAQSLAMLTGAVTNELFGSLNMEEKFREFRRQNRATIEQELLALAQELPDLAAPLTDALRMQALCDQASGEDEEKNSINGRILTHASEIGLLINERELPLPSTFMTMVRNLGDAHRLLTPPLEISPDEDKGLVQ